MIPKNYDALADFVASFYEDVITTLDEIDHEPADAQYKLGVRRLAWAFFNKFTLFEVGKILPELEERDVDAWYAGKERK